MRVRAHETICVVDAEGCAANFNATLARGLPLCTEIPAHDRPLAIVGAGPSVRDYLEEIRAFQGDVWAINGSYNWLLERGIVPQGFVGTDPLPGLAEYVIRAQHQTIFYMSGLCDPATFDALKGHDVKVWFPEQTDVQYPPGTWLVCGGSNALTRAPFLGRFQGYRKFVIYGADSSFDDESRYCYRYGTFAEDSKAPVNAVWLPNGEGPFYTELPLAKQVPQLWLIMQLDKFHGSLEIRCGGLMDAFLRSPLCDDSSLELVDGQTDKADAA